MIIRELRCDELNRYRDAIFELLINTYEFNFQFTREQCITICNEKLELLDEYIKQGSAKVVGAIKDDKLIGFLWLYKHVFFGEARLHINQIAVNSQSRGKGIGKCLIREAEKQAEHLGIKTIDLFVSEVNTIALKMYESLGFTTERRYLKKRI